MDFIIEHAGIFICFAVIVILATIGYYADKKDNKNEVKEKDNDDKNDNSVYNVDDKSTEKYSTPVLFSELPDISIDQDNLIGIHDNTNENNSFVVQNSNVQEKQNIEKNDIQKNIDVLAVDDKDLNYNLESANDSEQGFADNVELNNASIDVDQSFGVNNFENIDMSLEDLEKKNYDSFSLKDTDDENFYYSNIDNSQDNGFEENSIGDVKNNESVSVQDDNAQSIITDVHSNQIIDDKSTDVEEQTFTDDISLKENDDIVESDNNGHEFDSEVIDESVSDGGVVPISDMDSPIPEIDNINSDGTVDFSNSGASFNSDLTTDDIWKF